MAFHFKFFINSFDYFKLLQIKFSNFHMQFDELAFMMKSKEVFLCPKLDICQSISVTQFCN